MEDATRLYENKNLLNLGFMLPAAMTDALIYEQPDPVSFQNALSVAAGGTSVLCEDIGESGVNGNRMIYTVTRDGEYYAFVTNPDIHIIQFETPYRTATCENLDRKYLLSLGDLKAGDTIKFESLSEEGTIAVKVFEFDHAALSELYYRLRKGNFEIAARSDTRITGIVDCDTAALGYEGDGGILCFTIPYEEGWTATVDGKDCETMRIMDGAFLGVNVPDGTHTVTISYVPQGLVTGIFVSLFSLVLIFFLASLTRKRKTF